MCVKYCKLKITFPYIAAISDKTDLCHKLKHPLISDAEIYVTVTLMGCCVNLQNVDELVL